MADETITLVLDRDERQLLLTALELLEDTLGHEEADELRAVQALIGKVREAAT